MPASYISPLGPAIAVAAIGAAALWWGVGVVLRRRAERLAGIEGLATLKWRDVSAHLVSVLGQRGYREVPVERLPADSGFDALLEREGQRHLLACKHGRAYRLGEQTVRALHNAIGLQSAQGGFIATLGSIEPEAATLAPKLGIELIDGEGLWRELQPALPPALRQQARARAEAETKRRMLLGGALLALATIATYVSGLTGGADAGPAPVASVVPVAAPAAPQAVAAAEAVAAPAAAPADAAAQAVPTDPAELAERRLRAAQAVKTLEQVLDAVWATDSTLVISTRAPAEDTLIQAACTQLATYEELRFVRLQLESSGDAARPVRWRQCQ
jgi:hypothetical protein